MASLHADPSGAEIAGRIQENLIAYFLSFAGLPGVTVAESDVTWFVSARGAPGNYVLRARLSSDSAGRRIDEVFRQVSQGVDLGQRMSPHVVVEAPFLGFPPLDAPFIREFVIALLAPGATAGAPAFGGIDAVHVHFQPLFHVFVDAGELLDRVLQLKLHFRQTQVAAQPTVSLVVDAGEDRAPEVVRDAVGFTMVERRLDAASAVPVLGCHNDRGARRKRRRRKSCRVGAYGLPARRPGVPTGYFRSMTISVNARRGVCAGASAA